MPADDPKGETTPKPPKPKGAPAASKLKRLRKLSGADKPQQGVPESMSAEGAREVISPETDSTNKAQVLDEK